MELVLQHRARDILIECGRWIRICKLREGSYGIASYRPELVGLNDLIIDCIEASFCVLSVPTDGQEAADIQINT